MEKETKQKEYVWYDRKRHLGLPLSFTKYYVDNDRLYMEEGLFKTEINETLLYRILDIKSSISFGQKIFGVGTVTLYSADQSNHTLELKNVKNPKKVHRFLSEIIEHERMQKGITGRELVGTAGICINDDDDCGYHNNISFNNFE